MSTYEQRQAPGRHTSTSSSRGFFSGKFVSNTGRAPWQQKYKAAEERPPSPPVGRILKTVTKHELEDTPSSSEPAKISSCEYVGSYNWLNRMEPTIRVPGSPPVWTPLDKPRKLPEDKGTYFRDDNAARYPKNPTEPAVRALFESNPTFPTTEIDVFGCGSTLGNLIRFVQGIDRPFRFLVEVIGHTVFFIRRENHPRETINDVRGYGHTFPEAYTTWEEDVRGSESHQRIVRYQFAGLDFLVRSETDGYLRNLVPSEKDPASSVLEKQKNEDSTLISEALRLSSLSHQPSTSDTGLTVEKGGKSIAQEAIFDLKTRMVRKKDVDIVSQEIARLWVRQMPQLLVAYHEYGTFQPHDIHIHDVRQNMKEWERDNEDVLCQLATLIRAIVDFAKDRKEGKLEVRREEVDILELREQREDVNEALPSALKMQWAEGKGEDSSESEDDVGEEVAVEWDEESLDYTACSEDCGYCGHCRG